VAAQLTVGSLFSGIGGIDLGLERAGMRVVWQVEWDKWCRTVLRRHWPGVQQYGDVRDVDWTEVQRVDVLAGGIRANPLAWLDSAKGPMTKGIFGPLSGTPFASFAPDTRCWKTCQGTFPWASETYSETWPRSGTMRSGIAYQRPPLVPLTAVTACLSLPTPAAQDYKNGSLPPSQRTRDTLPGAVLRMLPTPTAAESGSELRSLAVLGYHRRCQLPTPTAQRYGSNTSCSPGAMARPSLQTMAARGMLPTPTAKANQLAPDQSKYSSGKALRELATHGIQPARGERLRLSPLFVEYLMGFPPGWTDIGFED